MLLMLTITLFSMSSFSMNQCIHDIESHVVKERGGRGWPYYYYLRVASCDLQDRDMPAIVAFLQKRNDITHLNLSGNHFTAEGAGILANSHLELTVIDASHNDLGDRGAIIFSQLQGKETWYATQLDLSQNNINDQGVQALAENTTWMTLGLDRNHIGDAGIIALAKNTKLENIYLNYNDIGNDGAVELARLTRINKTLRTIEVGWNHIGKIGLNSLKSLKDDKIIWNLWIDGNDGLSQD